MLHLNRKGLSLLQVTLGVFLAGMVTLLLSNFLSTASNVQRGITSNAEATELENQVRLILGTACSCTQSMGLNTLSLTDPGSTPLQLRFGPDNILVQEGKAASPTREVVSARLLSLRELEKRTNGNIVSVGELEVITSQAGRFLGNGRKSFVVNLKIETDAAGAVLSCYSRQNKTCEDISNERGGPPIVPRVPVITTPPAPVGTAQIFATSQMYTGNFAGRPGASRGAADEICMTHAAAANLTGTWRAVIVTGGDHPSTILSFLGVPNPGPDEGTGPGLAGGVRNMNGDVISDPGENFWRDEHRGRINYNEFGRLIGGDDHDVWTGLEEAWEVGETCSDWTSRSGDGDVGSSQEEDEWSEDGDDDCADRKRLFCISIP